MAQSLRRRTISAEAERNRELQRALDTSAEVNVSALASGGVKHHDGATEIGRLSAEFMAREYDFAAKEIEAIGAEMVELGKQCETMTRDTLAVIEELKEVAAQYRERGKRIFAEIEGCSELTADVGKTCAELKRRIVL